MKKKGYKVIKGCNVTDKNGEERRFEIGDTATDLTLEQIQALKVLEAIEDETKEDE